MFEFACDYMRDNTLRHALNRLTQKTFGFDFESWYTNGYFRGGYIPYTYLENGEAVANVSVNVMDFTLLQKRHRFAQIGTVMTAPEYRMRGLGRELMQKAIDGARGWAEDIYLFANESATGFYEKAGFRQGAQTRCVMRHTTPTEGGDFAPLDVHDDRARARYLNAVEHMRPNAAFALHNFGLVAFYTAGLEDVYYSPSLDAYAWAEQDGDTLALNGVVCERDISVHDVLAHLPLQHSGVRLGFTPGEGERETFEQIPEKDPDCVFYHRTDALDVMREKCLIFPEWSHA